MSTHEQEPRPISDALREAVQASGLSHRALSSATGVQRMSIQRFMAGSQSLRLDKADRLAEHLGLELTKRKRSNPDG